jgi:hypothetical protein
MASPAAAASPIQTLKRQADEETDDHGHRVIRHVGLGAYLTSRVDQKGRLLRQELLLGQDFVVWQHGTRIRTGICLDPEQPHAATYDLNPSRTRMEKARLAVQSYTGKDKYVRHLARVVVLSAGLGMAGAEVVTVSEDEAQLARAERRRAEAGGPSRGLLLALGAAVVAALLFWLLRK